MTLRKILTAPLLAWYRWRVKAARYNHALLHMRMTAGCRYDDYQDVVIAADVALDKLHNIELKIAKLS